MKKLLVVALAVSMVLMAASAYAAILNSKHDLTQGTANTVGASAPVNLSACQFCHTPHNANTSVTGAPLWNRTLFPTGSYSLYQSAISTTSQVTQLGANSKTCLSCHDGQISIGDVLVGTDQTTFVLINNRVSAGGILAAANPATIGVDLTNDHPVGMLVDPTGSPAGLDTIPNMESAGARFYGTFPNQRMECATCHDPHTATAKFLRMTPSTICTDCHVSK